MRATIACCMAAILLVACSKDKNEYADSSAGAVGGSATAATPAPAPAPVMTDANSLALLNTADSAEIALGKLGVSKATNPAVKSYAQMIVTDHSAHAKEVASTSTKATITPEAPASDNMKSEEHDHLQQFQSMAKGADFDSAFVNHMVADHEAVISKVQSLQSTTQNADVKALIDKTIPALQKHLDKGKELQTKLTK